MIKKLVLFFIIITSCTYLFIGCFNKKPMTNALRQEITFNQDIARQIVVNYMTYLKDGNFENAKKLCSPILVNNNQEIYNDELDVVSFKILDSSERGDVLSVKVLVNRAKIGKPQTDLDIITFEVKKEKENFYNIISALGETKCEVYQEGNSLKLLNRAAKEAESKTIVNLDGLQKVVYINVNKADIKLNVPNQNFSATNFSLNMDKIALSSSNGSDCFIGIAVIDEAIEVQGGNKENKLNDSKGDDDKNICKKLISLDMYKNMQVKEMFFSEEDNYLIVETEDMDKNTYLKIYDINKEELVQTNLENIFPIDKYEIYYFSNAGINNIIFEIKLKKDAIDARKDMLGKYKIDLKNLKVEKI